MANAHIMYVTFKIFKDTCEKADIKCPKTKENLTHLCKLYALTELQKDSQACYESGYFT